MSATDPSDALEIVLPPERWLSWDTRQRTGKSRYGPLVDFGDPVMNSRARPVAYIRRDDGTGGTGFLIAPDLLLTNNHVLPTPEHADRCTVWFNFIRGRAGLPQASEADPYRCRPFGAEGLFYTSPIPGASAKYEVDEQHLDFTLVRLEGRPGDRWGYVPVSSRPYTSQDMALTIIQHPRQRPTHVGVGLGQLKHRSQFALHYVTDTEPGSSGAPCFNEYWELVGVHHARYDFAVGALLEDGVVAAGDRKANEGIMITAILEDLAQNLPDAEIPAAQRDSKDVLMWL